MPRLNHLKRLSVVASCPVEVWSHIFRLATCTSNDWLNTSFDLSLAIQEDFKRTKDYESMIQTKLSISLVSKSWRALGLPYLFETIICRPQHLLETLDPIRVPALFNLKTSPLRHVRYVELCNTGMNFAEGLTDTEAHTLISFLHRCRNITIYQSTSVDFRFQILHNFLTAHHQNPNESSKCTSLRKLRLKFATLSPDIFQILAQATPQLEDLSLWSGEEIPETATPGKVTFLSLHSLFIGDIVVKGIEWNTPNLKLFRIFSGGFQELASVHAFPSTLRVVGALGRCLGPLQRVLDRFTSIEVLEVSSPLFQTPEFFCIQGNFSSIERIFVNFSYALFQRDFSLILLRRIFATVLNRDAFPRLREIGLRDLCFLDGVTEELKVEWGEWMKSLRMRGIWLHNENGDSIDHLPEL